MISKTTKRIPNLLVACFLLFCACDSDAGKAEKKADSQESDFILPPEPEATAVQTMILAPMVFQKELNANGKLAAVQKADLKFQMQGMIRALHIKEGQYVKPGQLLAELDDADQASALRQSELDHQKAILEYEDQLLRLGHRLEDTTALDKETKNIARLRSGLSLAEINLDRAGHQLLGTKLLAPFGGKIANLRAMPHNPTASYDFICTLIDDGELAVEFKVLEQELAFVRSSKTIAVTPFSMPDKSYTGRITGINPMIDKTGMVSVRAGIRHYGRLLEGMSVRVNVRQEVQNQLSVPKEAVLERQDRKVVFTLKDDSLAHWNYVEIADENSRWYVIKSGLSAGDEVIYKGNFNLAHDKKVVRSK